MIINNSYRMKLHNKYFKIQFKERMHKQSHINLVFSLLI